MTTTDWPGRPDRPDINESNNVACCLFRPALIFINYNHRYKVQGREIQQNTPCALRFPMVHVDSAAELWVYTMLIAIKLPNLDEGTSAEDKWFEMGEIKDASRQTGRGRGRKLPTARTATSRRRHRGCTISCSPMSQLISLISPHRRTTMLLPDYDLTQMGS